METVPMIILLVVLVVLIVLMIKAAKASNAIFETYEDVFGKGTAYGVMFSVYMAIGSIAYIIMIALSGKAEAALIMIFVVICLIAAAVAVLLVLRAKAKCPDELLPGFGKSLFITCFGAFGQICRWSWNGTCVIISLIPGCGWMNHFIISKDKEMKEQMVQAGERADAETAARWEREREEKKAREEEEAARIAEMQDEVRQKAWREDNRTDVDFNRDTSKWKYRDEDWSEARNVKKK